MNSPRNSRRVLAYLYEKLRNRTQAQIIWAIWYWRPMATITRNGQAWIAKTTADLLADGVMASERAIGDALLKLEQRGMLQRTRGPHPNRRTPNARLLWIGDDLFKELEQVACGQAVREPTYRETPRRDPAETSENLKSCAVICRAETAAPAASIPSSLPVRSGNARRFHKQETTTSTNKKTFISRERTRRGFSKEKGKGKLAIPSDLRKIQAAFARGVEASDEVDCAPELDTQQRINQLRRFQDACRAHGMSLDDTCEAAFLFAKHYHPDFIEQDLGRKNVSVRANHYVLGICAHLAISEFRVAKTHEQNAQFSDEDDD